MVAQQLSLFPKDPTTIPPFKTQFLKWIGNKQRIAHTIISHFPWHYDNYIEPFVGSGAVLGTLAPQRAIASDVMKPLIDLWQMLQSQPETVIEWYTTRWKRFQAQPDYAYRSIQASYNAAANAAGRRHTRWDGRSNRRCSARSRTSRSTQQRGCRPEAW